MFIVLSHYHSPERLFNPLPHLSYLSSYSQWISLPVSPQGTQRDRVGIPTSSFSSLSTHATISSSAPFFTSFPPTPETVSATPKLILQLSSSYPFSTTFLYPAVKEEAKKKKIINYFEPNENENTTYQNLWNSLH